MKILSPYQTFEDERGILLGLLNEGNWEEFNYLETKSGLSRGNHYHKLTREFFFIIEGEGEIHIQDEFGLVTEHPFKSKDLFVIEPGENHTFYCKSDTKWINALSKKFDNQAPDIHRR
jgi:mannose-6-phosphate isomerase-like protein (cupin superfamily)